MARMIPAQIGPEAPPSEAEIFRRFRDHTPSSWTVIHSQCFVAGGDKDHPARDGEIDFLLLDPERGFVALEVKGGGIRFESGQWYSTGQDQVEKAIKDPASQARKAAHEVDSFLRKQPWFKKNKVRLHFGWGVVFPDVDIPLRTGMGLPRDHILDRMDCTKFLEKLECVAKAQGLRKRKYPDQLTRAFLSTICPGFDARVPLARWFRDEKEILDHFTHEQISLLDHLEKVTRLAVEGAAGTGKTVVAMEKARRLAEAGKEVLFLCFNEPLADDLDKRAEGFQVFPYQRFCIQFAQRAGLKVEVPDDSRFKHQFYEHELPLLMMEALEKLPDARFDAIIVDEGQDFKPDWWVSIEDLFRNAKEDIWYVFFDPHQDIYKRGIPEMLVTYPFPLRYNVRNTGRIAEFCGQLCGSEMEPFPGIPEGLDVERISANGPKHLVKILEKRIGQLVKKERIAAHDMVLLSTRSRKASVLRKVKKLGSLTLVPLGSSKVGHQLRFDSIFRFKGLEADVVLLVDEGNPRTSTPRHLYVGASRARHLLVLIELEGAAS